MNSIIVIISVTLGDFMCMVRSKVKNEGMTGQVTGHLVARGYVAHCLYGLSLATGGR